MSDVGPEPEGAIKYGDIKEVLQIRYSRLDGEPIESREEVSRHLVNAVMDLVTLLHEQGLKVEVKYP